MQGRFRFLRHVAINLRSDRGQVATLNIGLPDTLASDAQGLPLFCRMSAFSFRSFFVAWAAACGTFLL